MKWRNWVKWNESQSTINAVPEFCSANVDGIVSEKSVGNSHRKIGFSFCCCLSLPGCIKTTIYCNPAWVSMKIIWLKASSNSFLSYVAVACSSPKWWMAPLQFSIKDPDTSLKSRDYITKLCLIILKKNTVLYSVLLDLLIGILQLFSVTMQGYSKRFLVP